TTKSSKLGHLEAGERCRRPSLLASLCRYQSTRYSVRFLRRSLRKRHTYMGRTNAWSPQGAQRWSGLDTQSVRRSVGAGLTAGDDAFEHGEPPYTAIVSKLPVRSASRGRFRRRIPEAEWSAS